MSKKLELAEIEISKLFTEKGNTYLIGDNDWALIIKLGPDLWLEVEDRSGNYPRICASVERRTEAEQAARIQSDYAFYTANRLNVAGVKVDADNNIVNPDEEGE